MEEERFCECGAPIEPETYSQPFDDIGDSGYESDYDESTGQHRSTYSAQASVTSRTDFDMDGIVTEREIDLEIQLEKAGTQTKIAAWALAAMIVLIGYLISPWGPPIERITALDASITTFFVAMASIVGAFMGFTAWMSRR